MVNMFGKVQEDSFQSIFDLSLDDLSSPLTPSDSERSNSSSSKMTVGAMAAQLGLLGSSSGNMRGSSHQSSTSSQETATLSANLVASLIALQKQQQQQQQQSTQGSPISPGAWGSSSAWGFGQRCQQQQHPLSLQQQHQHQQCPPESPTSSISSFDSCGINMRQRIFNDSALDSDSSSGSIPSSSASSSSGSSTAGGSKSSNSGGGGVAINSSRYKTELCRPFQENGTCKYGDKCQFAHGLAELRNISRHPKYKTDLCKTYHSSGFCPYGPRCHFIHNLEEQQASNPGAPNGQRQQQTAQTKPEKENPAQIAPLPIFQSQRHQVERQQEAVIRSAAAQMMGLMNNDLDNASGRQQQTTHMQQLRSSEHLSSANHQHQHQFHGQRQNTRQTSSRLPVFSTLYN